MTARVLNSLFKNKTHLAYLACLSLVLFLVFIIQKNNPEKVDCQRINNVCIENFYLKIGSKVQGQFSDYLNKIREFDRLHNYNKKWFPGTFIYNGTEQEAKFRVRGDLHTHYRSNQVSLRVKVKENKTKPARQLNFIIPWDKDYAIEPLAQVIAGELGMFSNEGYFGILSLIGQKSEFQPYYYVDEHLTKELLESKGYYSAPIFTFDTLWTELSDRTLHYYTGSSETQAFPAIKNNIFQLDVRKTYSSSSKKSVLIQTTIVKRLWEASREKNMASKSKKLLRQYLDLRNLEKFIAIQCFFGSHHGLSFGDNTRLYYNPKTTKFELFVWDVALMDLAENQICQNILNFTINLDSPHYHLVSDNFFENLVSNGILNSQNIQDDIAFLLDRSVHYKGYLDRSHDDLKKIKNKISFFNLERKSNQISKIFDKNIKTLSILLEK